jgi:hypothetical protein
MLTLLVAAGVILAAAGGVISSQSIGTSPVHDPEVTGRIVETGKSANRAMEHLDYLANQIGPRPAGSENHHKAGEWAQSKFKEFGLSNVHLEPCGEVSARTDEGGGKGFFKKVVGAFKPGDDDDAARVTVYNVVADIPGTETPDEYVIVGAHFDSVPIGTGALDNGTGVAATMEAARLLMESGARPKRTIRFVLFAGEESGLVGSRGYVKDHPELLPRISAMYNMDLGTHYISGISATEPLKDDLDAVFAPAKDLDSGMPFEVELVDWLLRGDPNCCPQGGAMV